MSSDCFNKQILEVEYESLENKRKNILNDLEKIIINSKTKLEGNSFYYHNSLILHKNLYEKQLNLFWCGKNAKKICEIGFNAGHSSLLFLLGNEISKISKQSDFELLIFDLGEHKYVKPCLEYMKTTFENTKFEYVEGDSKTTLSKWIGENKDKQGTYDIVHVDGGHKFECFINDMKNADILLKKNGLIIVDDTNVFHINYTVDKLINKGEYVELDFILKPLDYPHRIIRKV